MLAIALAAASGCSIGSKRVQSSDYPFDFQLNCLFDDRHVLIFLIDGCRPDLLQEMARKGELPAIKKYFIDRGVTASGAICPIPSITNSSVTATTCGAYPGRCNILGGRWFDREGLRRLSVFSLRDFYVTNDYLRRKTIYEILAGEPTVSIASRCSRGSMYTIAMWYRLAGLINLFQGKWDNIDRVFLEEFEDVADCANREGVFPRLLFVHLPAFDEAAHRYGAFSKEARATLRKIDRVMGGLFKGLERNGVLDRLCMMIISDHGHVPVGEKNHLIWEDYFQRELGLSALFGHRKIDHLKSATLRERYYNRYEVIMANNGRNAFLSFRHNPFSKWVRPEKMAPWSTRPSWDELRNYPTPRGRVDLIEIMLREQGVGYVIGRPRTGEIAFFTARGESVIRTKEMGGRRGYSYEVVRGEDPLGYREAQSSAAMVGGKYYSSREWLNATASLARPDIVEQIPSLFESPCCGDLFVVAQDGWDFEKGHVSGHGGFLRDEMYVPLIMAGPGIRKGGSLGPARLVDIAPTVLDYLGYGDRIRDYDMDGVSFLKEIGEGR
ncbi:MAG: alkaline phosphatase family protein [Candidatus Aureabacteria bacterium]|nr:alkaline phosphatase family protein [Candidatus Auribacterota bacterium]